MVVGGRRGRLSAHPRSNVEPVVVGSTRRWDEVRARAHTRSSALSMIRNDRDRSCRARLSCWRGMVNEEWKREHGPSPPAAIHRLSRENTLRSLLVFGTRPRFLSTRPAPIHAHEPALPHPPRLLTTSAMSVNPKRSTGKSSRSSYLDSFTGQSKSLPYLPDLAVMASLTCSRTHD